MEMTSITKEQAKHVAGLAKLKFEDDEINEFAHQLDDVVEMVETLDKVDTTNVPGTYHGIVSHSVMREDVSEEGTNRDELFKNVKNEKDGYIEVPAILENGEAGA